MNLQFNQHTKMTITAELIKTLEHSTWRYMMNDYYEELCDEWGENLVDEVWNFQSIYNGLKIRDYKYRDEIAALMFSVSNNSTWNDVLVDLTEGQLDVDGLAQEIFDNQ